ASSALSVGGYAYLGPHSDNGGATYAALTKRLWRGRQDDPLALFGHVGAKLEAFGGSQGSAGVRPFVGLNASVLRNRKLFLTAEFAPKQAWEKTNMFSLQG